MEPSPSATATTAPDSLASSRHQTIYYVVGALVAVHVLALAFYLLRLYREPTSSVPPMSRRVTIGRGTPVPDPARP
eukprot:tig00000342_g24208.t1